MEAAFTNVILPVFFLKLYILIFDILILKKN